MSNREPITVSLYHRLLEMAREHLVLAHRYRSVARIVQEASIQYISDRTLPLPYNPARFSSKLQQTLCDERYQRAKTVVSVDKGLFIEYKQELALRCKELYKVENEKLVITNRYAVESALWFTLKRAGIEVCDPYFDDDRLLDELNIDNVIAGALQQVAILLGHSPTAREYDKHSKTVGGPSLSFIKEVYGSFNEAKKKAGLEKWDWGRRG